MSKIIKDVIVMYAHVGVPVLKYQRKPMKDFPMGNKEYVVDVLIPSKTFKSLEKHYKKSKVKAFKEAKSLSAAEFENAFKVAPPEDEKYQNEDGEFTVIKFRDHASYNDGEPTKNPPKIVGVSKTKDRNGETVGLNVAIGNGSLCNLQFKESPYTVPDSGTKGLSLKLAALQVLELIAYESDGLDFDMEDEDEPETKDSGEFEMEDESDDDTSDDSSEADDDDDSSWDD